MNPETKRRQKPCAIVKRNIHLLTCIFQRRPDARSSEILTNPTCQNLTREQFIDLVIQNHITRLTKQPTATQIESFFIADLGQVTLQHQRWLENLNGIQPYYAVKCNIGATLLQHLAELGTGFDCASVEEMRAVLSLGIDPARILFANPCKAAASLVFARRAGVFKTTFDNLDELDSIKRHMPEAQLLLRIYANDDTAVIGLGEKFGAPSDTTFALLARAWELGLDVIGVSFHVGTGARDPKSFCKAIQDARLVFSQAQQLGFKPTILDIGGGFQDETFNHMASVIRESIRAEFQEGVIAIAEPGRFFARNAYTLVCRVIARRKQIGSAAADGVPDMLYQNDGVYGNFMNVILEKEVVSPQVVSLDETHHLQRETKDKTGEFRYSVWGPTCDSVDCVVREASFDREVRVGDYLKYENMGAYTTTTRTSFNGFSTSPDILYVDSESRADD